jgi:hypothetical protein
VLICLFFFQFGDKVVKNPLMQHLGHTSLTLVNGGLRGSAKVFETLDKGVDFAAKKAYQAIAKVGETAVGKAIAARANKLIDSRVGQRVVRTLDEMKAVSSDLAAPIEKVKEFLGNKYVKLGSRFGIAEEKSRQAVKDFETTAKGIARYAPVAMSVGSGISALSNLGVVARDSGMRAAGQLVKQQVIDAAKAKMASYSAAGTSATFVQGMTSRIPLASVADRLNNLVSSSVVQKGLSLADKAMTAKNAFDGTLQDLALVRDRVGAVYDYGKAVAERDAGGAGAPATASLADSAPSFDASAYDTAAPDQASDEPPSFQAYGAQPDFGQAAPAA